MLLTVWVLILIVFGGLALVPVEKEESKDLS